MNEITPPPDWISGLSPERETILQCARAEFDPSSAERIRFLSGRGLNWNWLLAESIEQRVSPIVYETLNDCSKDLIPPEGMDSLRQLAQRDTANGFLRLRELLRLVELFEKAQIPAIPYKGPVLSQIAYGNFVRRCFTDLDIVVAQEYMPRVAGLMQTAGYRFEEGSKDVHAGRSGFAPGQYTFCHIEQRVLVEFHTERTLRYLPLGLNFQEVQSRLMSVDAFGQTLRTFSVEDTILLLSVHGAKHLWRRLFWILDIPKLITRREVNWELLLEIAGRAESRRVVLLAVYLAQNLLGAPLPAAVSDEAGRDRKVRKLAEHVYQQYQRLQDLDSSILPRAVFRMRSSDGNWKGAKQLARVAMSPTEADREAVSLPRQLAPLYRLARPFGLLRRYGLGWSRRFVPDLAIYLPTPLEVVDKMLRLADVSPGDVLYDPGCGDGRIVIAAAEKYGIRAVGIDINPKRIAEARANAQRHGVERLVEFRLSDAKQHNLSEATVVAMYLGVDGNLRLVDQFRSDLRPGARIVSRAFPIIGWVPDRTETYMTRAGEEESLFLWVLKENAGASPKTSADAVRQEQESKPALG